MVNPKFFKFQKMADRDARKAELDRKKAKLAQMKADKQRREVGFECISLFLLKVFSRLEKREKKNLKNFSSGRSPG